jgi:hypothetical protein
MSLIKGYIPFPTLFDPFNVFLGRDGVRFFGGSFLSQLLSVPTVVLSRQRIGILVFLRRHHLVVRWGKRCTLWMKWGKFREVKR